MSLELIQNPEISGSEVEAEVVIDEPVNVDWHGDCFI